MAFLCLVAALFWARGRAARITTGVVCAALFLISIGGGINAYFEYYPQLRDLFGYRGADAAGIDELDTTTIPSRGKLVEFDIPATKSGFGARTAQVYVPPAWFAEPKPALPVIVLLQGSPGETTDWSLGGKATQTADAFAARNGGKAPVLVMADPNGSDTADTECIDTAMVKPETYLVEDVPAKIIDKFGTAPTGKDWSIAGLSEGGMCSIMLALRHPDVFSTFGDFGGLLGPRSGDGNSVGSTVKDLFAWSQSDFDAHEPQKLLETTKFAELGFDVWSAAFQDSLPWFAARSGLVDLTPAMTAKCATP